MHAIDLIAAALPTSDPDYPVLPDDPIPGVCCITGSAGPTLPRAALLGPSFTAGELLALPAGDRVGVAAWLALRYKWERMSSWIVSRDGFRRLDRQGVRAAVLGEPPAGPWAAYATTSYKKHGALLAPVNSPWSRVWQWEAERVDCTDPGEVADMWSRLRAAQDLGLSRAVLETLECPAWLAGRVGIKAWLEYQRWALRVYRSARYRFLCYLLPSQEELRSAA